MPLYSNIRPVQTQVEKSLEQFVHWSLTESVVSSSSPEARLQLLNCAWEAQKLLWRLRLT